MSPMQRTTAQSLVALIAIFGVACLYYSSIDLSSNSTLISTLKDEAAETSIIVDYPSNRSLRLSPPRIPHDPKTIIVKLLF